MSVVGLLMGFPIWINLFTAQAKELFPLKVLVFGVCAYWQLTPFYLP